MRLKSLLVMDKLTKNIIDFLLEIGLTVEESDSLKDTFLPGVTVSNGVLMVDSRKLTYPGDLLHEAGHLAVLTKAQRLNSTGDFSDDGGYEMAAIAWSFAASVHLGLAIDVVFHKGGYKNDSDWLIELFTSGKSIGVPILEWKGMTTVSERPKYPNMKSWLCDLD